MRYTRYDIRKKNSSNKILLIGVLVVAAAFIIGSLISDFVLKNSSVIKDAAKANAKEVQNQTDFSLDNSINVMKFETVQCGIFNDKNNLNAEKNLVSDYGVCFTADDTSGTRLFLGIYPQTDGDKISKILSDKGIDNVKAVYLVNKDTLCDAEIAEIINANLQILNRASEKDIKSVKTNDLKKWLSKIKSPDKNSKNYKKLTELISYTNNLPNELSKEKVAVCYDTLYKILKAVSIN